MELSDNAKKIFLSLYCKPEESIEQACLRVSKAFATDKNEEDRAFKLITSNVWRPNTPVWFNSSQKEKLYSACWVVPLEDSMDGIYDVANIARKIFSSGAGIGIPLGNLREKDAPIFGSFDRTARCYSDPLDTNCEDNHDYDEYDICKICGKSLYPEGNSSGPLIFMKLFDAIAATTKSGGRARRAAILCCMPIWHPDILDFIHAKEIDGSLSNMNISVGITDKFMQSLSDKTPFSLHTPYNGSFIRNEDPTIIWDEIAKMAWKSADPGVLFLDTVNYYNPLKKIMLIQSTNPCGEQPLIPFGCCQLSSINLTKFVDEESGIFEFVEFEETVKKITVLMDNILDNMDFPDERFKDISQKYRPIGIGFMGLSDAMFMLDIKYNSQSGKDFVAEITKSMTRASIEQSALLAKERGKFFNYDIVKEDVEEIVSKLLEPISDEDKRVIELVKEHGLRNCQHTTVAPTGTTALSCDCSYGIEPCFGLVWEKNLMDNTVMKLVNPIFEKRFKDSPWWTDDILDKIAQNSGSLKNVRGIPKDVKNVFVVAHDIAAKDRIELQAASQAHLSTSISSTVNLPNSATVEEVKEIFQYAYDLGLKGVTIYRDGTKKGQPVTFKSQSGEAISTFVRPTGLPAIKHCIQLAEEKLYVDVVKYQGKIVEIWMEYGQAGHEMNIILKGWGKTLSTALQHGVPVSAVVKQLKNMKGENPVWFRFEENDKKPAQLFSVCDALAKLLERYYVGENSQLETLTNALECPKCRNMTYIMTEGCYVCQSCGFSKCS